MRNVTKRLSRKKEGRYLTEKSSKERRNDESYLSRLNQPKNLI